MLARTVGKALDGSPVTLRDNLIGAAWTSPAAQKALDGPGIAPELRHLWDVFLELHNTRGAGAMSLNPITFAEIDAWQRVTGRYLSASEVHLLRVADMAALTQIQVNSKSGAEATDG